MLMKRTRNRQLLNWSTIWTCQMKITSDPLPDDADEAWLHELLEHQAPGIMQRYYQETPLFRLLPDTICTSTQVWHRRLTFPQVYFRRETRQLAGIWTGDDIDEQMARFIIADANITLAFVEQCRLIPYHCDSADADGNGNGMPYIGPATYSYLRQLLKQLGIDSGVNGDYQEWIPGKGGKGFITYQPVERWAIKYNPCRNKRKK